MGVADVTHVVRGVEKFAAQVVVHVLHPSLDDFEGFLVRHTQGLAQVNLSGLEYRLGTSPAVRLNQVGDPQDQVRIRTKTEPHCALPRGAGARKISGIIEKVRNDLDVQMRRPMAVDGRVPDRPNASTLGDGHACRQPLQRLLIEMTIQSEKLACAADCMPEDDSRPVIERPGVVAEAVHGAFQRGKHRGPHLHEEINAQVDRAPLVHLTAGGTVVLSRVGTTGFIIASDPDAHLGRPHPSKQRLGEELWISGICDTHKLGTPSTQIEHHVVALPHVGLDDRTDGARVCLEPLHHCHGAQARGHSAGASERVVE